MVVSGGQGGDSTIHIHVSILPHEHIGFFLSIAAVFKFRCKPVGICFGLLQQFSKPEILNSAEFSNSLVCVIDMFHSFGNQMNAFEYQSIHLVTIY